MLFVHCHGDNAGIAWPLAASRAKDVGFAPRSGGYWSMYCIGMGQQVFVKSYAGGNEWRQILGLSAQTVAVSQNVDGRQEVMCIGTNNGICHAWQSNPTEW